MKQRPHSRDGTGWRQKRKNLDHDDRAASISGLNHLFPEFFDMRETNFHLSIFHIKLSVYFCIHFLPQSVFLHNLFLAYFFSVITYHSILLFRSWTLFAIPSLLPSLSWFHNFSQLFSLSRNPYVLFSASLNIKVSSFLKKLYLH